jgi:probable rRNA maturation factor
MNNIIIQNVSKTVSLPKKKELQKWVDQALSGYKKNHEIVIRFVDIKEITQLNRKYRKKNKPTNIISFQFESPPGIKTKLLGDLVICTPLAKKEAKIQHKTITAHLAHLVTHGVLHLLDYDHETKKEAEEMENLEIKYLKKLGFTNPYT